MENKTLQLLKQIERALESGQMKTEDIPVQDIYSCCAQEMMLNRMWYDSKESFDNSIERLAVTIELISDNPRAVLDVCILCMELMPKPSKYQFSSSYWKQQSGSRYGEEAEAVFSYIEKNECVNVFNYEFSKMYAGMNIEVFMDEASGHYYVMFEGKRMYFPIGWEHERIREYCVGIYMEQDRQSPHCYYDEEYGVREGDVVIDGGTAEGNFALNVIDKAKKIYLVETEEEWVETLNLTFSEYKDKVVIVNGFLDEKTEQNHYSLADIATEEVNYVKMDIEGFERCVLRGAEDMLVNANNLRMAICSYHCNGDYEWITDYLSSLGYATKNSHGYMFPEWEVSAAANCELRRGLVFAKKGKGGRNV